MTHGLDAAETAKRRRRPAGAAGSVDRVLAPSIVSSCSLSSIALRGAPRAC